MTEDISHQEEKQAKYSSQNPIAKYLVSGFFSSLEALLTQPCKSSSEYSLEVGCGEGELLNRLRKHNQSDAVFGCDIDFARLSIAASVGVGRVIGASAYELPFEDRQFGTVVCCEVLEHLEDPRSALQEISRVADDKLIFSVPNEPIWRAMNMARGKYWNDLGNTPGHINHWSSGEFLSLVGGFFNVQKVVRPLPWTMILARKKND